MLMVEMSRTADGNVIPLRQMLINAPKAGNDQTMNAFARWVAQRMYEERERQHLGDAK